MKKSLKAFVCLLLINLTFGALRASEPEEINLARYESALRLKAIVDDDRLIEKDNRFYYGNNLRVEAAKLLLSTVLTVDRASLNRYTKSEKPYRNLLKKSLELCVSTALGDSNDLEDRLMALKVIERASFYFTFAPDLEDVAKKTTDPRIRDQARKIKKEGEDTEQKMYKFGFSGKYE